MRTRLQRFIAQLTTASPTPAIKQMPFAAFFVVALFLALLLPTQFVSSGAAVIAAMVLALVASILAVYVSSRPVHPGWVLLVPSIDFVAIGLLRGGMGSGNSAFGALVLLPILWLAAERGRRFVLFATLGAVVAVLIPLAIEWRLAFDPQFVVRSLVSPLVFVVAAVVVNQLARHWQARAEDASQRAEERARLLREAVEHAERLAEREAELRALERMFRGLWAAVTEQSVIGTDRTGLIDAWSPGATKMLGYTDDETEGIRRVDEFHLQDELAARSKELNYPAGETVLNPGFSALVEPARLGVAEIREWAYRASDGRIIPVDLAVTPRLDESGDITGYLFIASDLTKAKELSRLKDEFVGLISHELRTPLSSILGYLELLRDEDGTELTANQLHYLSVAERNANRLLRLVGDLLFTAQVDSGMFQVDQSEQNLSAIVAASVESARPAAATAGIELAMSAPDRTIIRGDVVRLGQACDNLISNALKFTPRGGNVTVSVVTDAENATVSFQDTGMGIPPAELDKLFSRFFRASTATRNAVPGVGLGLVITKAIVSAHGGELGVTSEEGAGTRFTMSLPLAPVSA
ncbi:signal transduction histidine kinase [Cryobacterium mesophilum]|nr:ATP-binding protein [Terrimesophilobacter mesophilus]MBB5633879.1 signal transduction histidine kinase [Terrimesophilobacter mesophilus]